MDKEFGMDMSMDGDEKEVFSNPLEKSRKPRSELSDESNSESESGDEEVCENGFEAEGSQHLDEQCDNDEDEKEEEVVIEHADDQKEEMETIKNHFRNLTRGTLMKHASKQRLLQDPGSGIFLVDGDSLLIEAMSTRSWKYGQQLHLFHVIETYLNQLSHKQTATFHVVFFNAMKHIWSRDLVAQTMRVALIYHLKVNCGITVHHEWEDPFEQGWIDYLEAEAPSYVFLHDGFGLDNITTLLLKLMAYTCLAGNLDVAYTDDIHSQSSKLHAVLIKSLVSHSTDHNKTYLTQTWTCLKQFFSKGTLSNGTDHQQPTSQSPDVSSLRDRVFIESIRVYWDSVTTDEAKQSSEILHRLNSWCRYFAVLSQCNLDERISIAREDLQRESTDKLEEGSQTSAFVLCLLRSLEVLLGGGEYADSGCVADQLDLSLYSQVFDSESVPKCAATAQVLEKHNSLIVLAKSAGITVQVVDIKVKEDGDNNEPIANEVDESMLVSVRSRLSEEFAKTAMQDSNFTENNFEEIDEFEGVSEEVYNWLSGNSLKDDIDQKATKALSKVPYIRMKQLKSIQKFNDFLVVYGQAFEGFTEPTMITKNENKNKDKENKKEKPAQKHQKQQGGGGGGGKKGGGGGKGGKQGNKGKSMKESIIEDNNKKKMDETRLKVATQWKTKKGEIEELNDPALAISKVSEFIDKSECCKISYEEPYNYLLQLQYDKWKSSSGEEGEHAGVDSSMADLAELVHTMHKILQNEAISSESMKTKIVKYFRKTGFEDAATLVAQTLTDKKKLEKSSGKGNEKGAAAVKIPYNVFQIQYMGHLMKRQIRTDPDPRVTGFIPDTWQRELLDIVDKNESAVIVAPTSSGKTFCSFYCMEKVLRESDDGVVVYVSPTKALVNQILASIYARYKKTMPAGTNLVGSFTRDYQHNPLTSQILVTVPQCLEMLLLSPKRQQWCSRLRYVIFDEVHCIGGEHGGEVWEHLLTLVRCPFLALSATVGNPEYFHGWLRAVNKLKELQHTTKTSKSAPKDVKYSVKLVVHNERFSDIRKSVYLPDRDAIAHTHPCLFLDPHFLATKGFPAAFTLAPSEAYELWFAGKHTFKDEPDQLNILEAWNPVQYFGEELYIVKNKAREYEMSLKDKLAEMLANQEEKAGKLVSYFHEKMPGSTSTDGHITIPGVAEKEFNLYSTFPTLIEKLRSEEKLPAIVFMNDRRGVEKLTSTLNKHVDKKIEEVRSKMSGAYSKVDGEKTAKKPSKGKKNVDSEGEEIEDHIQEYMKGEMNRAKLAIQMKENACKFIKHSKLTQDERDKVMAKYRGTTTGRSMLENGIGYHHEGCDVNHKRAVEYHFLSQYAQVVAATRTLALGIHFPCRTVVFVGNDHFVDALNYRQMSGRSGRRGFDNLGNVVFYGVPLPKIGKLIRADISKLEGQYPVNCTIILRLLILAANCTDVEDAHQKAMLVVSHPFLAHQSPAIQNQLKYYFLFASGFLVQQALVDTTGSPLAFSGLVSHLHHNEPANFAFVYLLKRGFFHKICKPSPASKPATFGTRCKNCNSSPIVGPKFTCGKCYNDHSLCGSCFAKSSKHKMGRNEEHTSSDYVESPAEFPFTYTEESLTKLLCVLCHLFCDEKIPNMRLVKVGGNTKKTGELRLRGKCTKSKVLLDGLPTKIHAALVEYNENVRSIFGSYLRAVSKSIKRDSNRVELPLSKKTWKISAAPGTTVTPLACAVDPFVQLSGCSDADVASFCLDTREISRFIPTELYMDVNFVPSLAIDEPRNAYPLDFFIHGSRAVLESENWLPVNRVYDALNDFRLAIERISVALEQFSPEKGDDHVICAFKHLSYEYNTRFNKAFFKGKKK